MTTSSPVRPPLSKSQTQSGVPFPLRPSVRFVLPLFLSFFFLFIHRFQVKHLQLTQPLLFGSLAIIAIHSFKANGPCQVSFTVGDKLKIQERIAGWYKGIVLSNGKKGIFPMSFVHLYVIDEKDRDTVSEELVNASWEWTGLLKSYFRVGPIPFSFLFFFFSFQYH